MKKSKIMLIALVLAGGKAFSQESKSLTLDEALQLGIANSKNLKIDEARVQEATANYIEARNRRLPDFKVEGSALAMTNATVDLKLLPKSTTGGKSPKANSAFFGQANFSLPLFAGGRIRYGIESANYLIEAQKLSNENDKISVAYNISQAYNNLFKANQAIKVLDESLKASEARDKQFLKLENNGVIARNDRLKANLQTNNIELQLLDAKNNYNIANINMDLLLGLPETTQIQLDPNYANETLTSQDVSYYLNQAVQNRKDVQAYEYRRKAADLAIKSAKAENLPTIALTAGYVAADVPKILTVYNAANIGLGVQYNLANIWKKNTSLLQAQARMQELDASNDLLNDQIKLDVNRDFQNSEFAKRKIDVYNKAVEQAEENYRITKNKYDNGLATMTELLDADVARISANINVVNAKADAALAYRKLLQSTGIYTTN